MNEIKRNICLSEDGEHTDFIAQIIIKYNGEEYSWKVDLGAECNNDGILPKQKFDISMEYLRMFTQYKLLYGLKIIHLEDPAKLNPCYACHRY